MKARYTHNNTHLEFFCVGCDETHSVRVEKPTDWQFNGDLESPTLNPSVLIRSGHYMNEHKQGDPCWCTAEIDTAFHCKRCHTFVRNGMIEFLSDCSHSFAGQTIELPELEKEEKQEESLDDFFDKVEPTQTKPRIHNNGESTCVSCEG